MKRSRWQRFRRLLAHEFDCPASRSDWNRPLISCDLDWGHKGLHQHFEGDHVWVWATDAWYSARIPSEVWAFNRWLMPPLNRRIERRALQAYLRIGCSLEEARGHVAGLDWPKGYTPGQVDP